MGLNPRLVTDSFSKSSEYYVPDTVLGTKDTFVNRGDQLCPKEQLRRIELSALVSPRYKRFNVQSPGP